MTVVGPETCIYCLKSGGPFAKEHILSAFLGGPNRYQLHKCVCRKCNSETISRQENYFKEDSPGGLLAAIYGVGRSKNYRPNYDRLKLQIETDGVWPFDPDVFTSVGGDGKMRIEKQIVLRGQRPDPYIIREKFTPKEIVEKMDWVGGEEIEMLTYGFSEEELQAINKGLEELGKKAAGIETRTIQPGTTVPKRAYLMEHLEDRDLKRVVLKTVFNYFAYCALPGFGSIVYSGDFSPLRDYVLKTNGEYQGGELVPPSANIPIKFNGSLLNSPSKNHLIRIYRETQMVHKTTNSPKSPARILVGELNLFSTTQYKVNLAFDPFPEILPKFGCGHLIDLEADKWIRVDREGNEDPPDDFALFRS
jgi:hypothetical protein